jgi:hypothetical protein
MPYRGSPGLGGGRRRRRRPPAPAPTTQPTGRGPARGQPQPVRERRRRKGQTQGAALTAAQSTQPTGRGQGRGGTPATRALQALVAAARAEEDYGPTERAQLRAGTSRARESLHYLVQETERKAEEARSHGGPLEDIGDFLTKPIASLPATPTVFDPFPNPGETVEVTPLDIALVAPVGGIGGTVAKKAVTAAVAKLAAGKGTARQLATQLARGKVVATGGKGAARREAKARAAALAEQAKSGHPSLETLRKYQAAQDAVRTGAKVKPTVKGVAKATPKAVWGTAKVAARAATYPIRRPIKTAKGSFYAQAVGAPAATVSDPGGEAKKVLEGKGIAATVLGDAGSVAASVAPGGEIAKNLVKDVFDLPAQTVPAIYLPLAGLVEAAQGNSERLDQLWEDYKKVGLLPAVARGDPAGALKAIKEHPLFAGLEARGAQAVVGRTAGAVARRTTGGKVGGRIREPIEIGPGLGKRERRYSPDLIERAVQVAADKRRGRKYGDQVASPRQRERLLRETVDRVVGAEEGARRLGRTQEAEGAAAALKEGGLGRLSQVTKRGRIERQLGVSLAQQGVLRSPRTFKEDIAQFAAKLDDSRRELEVSLRNATEKSRQVDIRKRIKANQQMRDQLEVLREADPEAIFGTARANAPGLRQIDEELGELGALPPEQAAQARLIPFARTHLDADYGVSNQTKTQMAALQDQLATAGSATEQAAIRGKMAALGQRKQIIDREGNALPPERIEAEARRLGAEPESFAFVSQRPRARGARSFYRAFWPDRAGVAKAKRTGKATTEGTFDPSFDAIVEQRIRGRGIVDAIRGFDNIAKEFALEGKRYEGWNEAAQAAERIEEATGMAVRPVRLTPLRARAVEARRAEEIFDTLDPSNQRGMDNLTKQLLDDAVAPGEAGPYVLLPDQVVQRLGEHFQAATTTRRVAQVLSSGFKGVVLPTSPNWLLGNFVDVNMRTALSGTTPFGFNAGLGRKLMREVERQNPELAKRIRAGLVPGSIYGAADQTRTFRDARQFAGTSLAPLARSMGTLRRTPGVKQTVSFYGKYRDTVFDFNRRFLEDQAFYAMLGKQARREVRARTNRWEKGLRLGEEAVRGLAKGLTETQEQIRFAKAVEETLGQWTANSPGARMFLVDYAPFAMWTRAATKFVLYTLPVKHPIKTAIAAAAYEMTEEEREALGLSHFTEGALPPNLQGSIPTGDGGLVGAQTITSFGYFADYQNSLASSFLPQFPLAELAGLDWTGKKLAHEDGTPLNVQERAIAAALSMGEAYIPFLAMGKRMSEDGPTAALPRTVRPYDKELVEWLRKQSGSRTITVPAKGEGGSSSSGSKALWGSGSSSSKPKAAW